MRSARGFTPPPRAPKEAVSGDAVRFEILAALVQNPEGLHDDAVREAVFEVYPQAKAETIGFELLDLVAFDFALHDRDANVWRLKR